MLFSRKKLLTKPAERNAAMESASNITFTKHALDMLKERKLPRELVESIVLSPDRKEKGEQDIWFAFRQIKGKVLRVVVRGHEPPYVIITTYFDRRLKI